MANFIGFTQTAGLNPDNIDMILKRNITKPDSFTYLRTQLEMGTALSRFIQKLPIEKGKVFAFVPKGTPEELLFKFDSGGIYPYDEELRKQKSVVPIRNESRPLVADEILRHLALTANSCCLFEEALAIPSDPIVITSKVEFVHLHNSEMYYFFDNDTKDIKEIADAIKNSESHIFLCALSSLDRLERMSFSPYKEISLGLLEMFVKNISCFFVKAYDGEGYLMWTAE